MELEVVFRHRKKNYSGKSKRRTRPKIRAINTQPNRNKIRNCENGRQNAFLKLFSHANISFCSKYHTIIGHEKNFDASLDDIASSSSNPKIVMHRTSRINDKNTVIQINSVPAGWKFAEPIARIIRKVTAWNF